MTVPSPPGDDKCWNPAAAGSSGGWGYQIDPVGSENIFRTTEDLGWDLAIPHANLVASWEFAASLFLSAGAEAAQVNLALGATWNRVIGRNMAYAEGTIQGLVSGGREALGHLQKGECDMVANTVGHMVNRRPDGAVANRVHRD